MTILEEKLAKHKQREYLVSHYGALVKAAGYADDENPLTISAEECLLLFNPIRKRAEALAGRLLPNYEDLLAVVEALDDEEKRELRESINFKQPQYDPKKKKH
jgi:hypothetical protein